MHVLCVAWMYLLCKITVGNHASKTLFETQYFLKKILK